jgi:hypothetical protein
LGSTHQSVPLAPAQEHCPTEPIILTTPGVVRKSEPKAVIGAGRVGIAGVGHPERREQIGLQILSERLLGDLFDGENEQIEASTSPPP